MKTEDNKTKMNMNDCNIINNDSYMMDIEENKEEKISNNKNETVKLDIETSLSGIITSDLIISLLSQAGNIALAGVNHKKHHSNTVNCSIGCRKDQCALLIKKFIIPLSMVNTTFNKSITTNKIIWIKLYNFIAFPTDITNLLERNVDMIRKMVIMKYIAKPLLDLRNNIANYCKSSTNLPPLLSNLPICTNGCVMVVKEKTMKYNGTHITIRQANKCDPAGCIHLMRREYFSLAIKLEHEINSLFINLHIPVLIS